MLDAECLHCWPNQITKLKWVVMINLMPCLKWWMPTILSYQLSVFMHNMKNRDVWCISMYKKQEQRPWLFQFMLTAHYQISVWMSLFISTLSATYVYGPSCILKTSCVRLRTHLKKHVLPLIWGDVIYFQCQLRTMIWCNTQILRRICVSGETWMSLMSIRSH